VERDSVGVVLITGGASGLGAAVAKAVESDDGTPVVLDRVAPTNGFDHEIVDLADGEAARAATLRAVDRHGQLDAVVTCAGTDTCGRIEDVSWEAWDRVIRVNLLGTVAVIRAALPALRESHGRVVTVASTLGLRVLSDATAYCASKFGVVGFTRALAAELAGDVGVTLLIPGGMRTAFFDGREERYKPPDDAELIDPEDVASTVVFVLSQPRGCEVRELVVTPSREPSWP
jgi:NAD(P)-dependent dehydrogenase (short-subunit alcohol dehydrogenase family)